VNSPLFDIDYILELGENDLKQEIQLLGMGSKNATDIMEMYQKIKNTSLNMDTLLVLYQNYAYDGVRTKIAFLVLYLHIGKMMQILLILM